MGFLEKQQRALGFLLSVIIELILLSILINGYNKIEDIQYIVLLIIATTILVCLVGQIKFYKIKGCAYILFSLPSLILGIILFIVINFY